MLYAIAMGQIRCLHMTRRPCYSSTVTRTIHYSTTYHVIVVQRLYVFSNITYGDIRRGYREQVH